MKIGRFLEIEDNVVKTKRGEILGFISFEPKWKKNVFQPDELTFYDSECLTDISKYLGELDGKKGKSN